MKGIATALAKAQANMGKALKQANNPHFRSKYADLGNVMDACLPALNEAGIALIQPTGEDEHGRYVETILIHGESGEQLACKVPLIVAKNERNDLFSLSYNFDRGYRKAELLCVAYELLERSGAGETSAEDLQRELFALGTSVRFSCNAENSSIDVQGRYAYGNQPPLATWNLARFAETLLPQLAHDGIFDQDHAFAFHHFA